ncbi:MAG: hypothetical protein KDA80_10450 [Planctomycetaceae bacterium]|nr:hypothetical protein [Planctomycetaceae bacterium]
MNQDDRSQKTSLFKWIERILGLVAMGSCLIVNEAINHKEFLWYQKGAWFFVFTFAFLGAANWIRSTYRPEELNRKSPLVSGLWWILIGVILIGMLVFVIGRVMTAG